MGYKVGWNGKVTLGANTVVGMGSWKLEGIVADEFESTAFQDNWKQYMHGAKDGGTLTFAGLYDPADTTGQQAIMNANLENTDLTDLRFYVDDTSYFVPCQTTGYFSPTTTTGADTLPGYVNIVGYNVEADKGGLMAIDFSAKVSGAMVLV